MKVFMKNVYVVLFLTPETQKLCNYIDVFLFLFLKFNYSKFDSDTEYVST